MTDKPTREARYMPAWIRIDEAAGEADCGLCNMGITAPAMFGPIPRANMLASFVVLHATHSERGMPSGLTRTGRISRAASQALTQGATP